MKKNHIKPKRKYGSFKRFHYPAIRMAILFIAIHIYHSSIIAQQSQISITKQHVSLTEILKSIKEQSGKSLLYNNDLIDRYQDESIDIKKASLEEALKQCLKGKNLHYRIVKDVIIIEPGGNEPDYKQNQKILNQTVRGQVIDNDSKAPLPGANVLVLYTYPLLGTITNQEGNFRIEKVPVGRHNIQISYIGYDPVTIPEVIISSGKEVIIDVVLIESVTELDEIVIRTKKDKPVNSMATVSALSFTVEEARRYAGSLDDPARLVSAFAGVTINHFGDNAVIVRGNAPKGILWKLEGVEIPNPNHFSGANTLGGGFVTIFSSQLLAKSDFFTGAFPAEYGNALSGVFDMKLRNGNNEKREHTFQVGVLGTDIASEGPFKKGHDASYIFNYRYSTSGLLSELGILPIGEQISKYQDLSFKLNFPTENAGTFSIWGIGGLDYTHKPEEQDSTIWESYWDRMNQDWSINTGAIGIAHRIVSGEKTYLHTTFAATGVSNTIDYKYLDSLLILQPNWLIHDKSGKITLSTSVNHKFGARTTLKTGATCHALFYSLDMSSTVNNIPSTFQNFVNEDGYTSFLEYFAQASHKMTNNFSVYPGIYMSYFNLNKKYSIDPRFSIKWNFFPNHSISFGYGKHSQREDLKIYFFHKEVNGPFVYLNKNLELSKANHFVAAYDWRISSNLVFKLEPYCQYLFDIPGIKDSTYSMINFKQDWTFRGSLVNNSVGINKGIDITLERFLHDNYYFLITASLFDSKYKVDGDVWRNTRYNKDYVINLLFGKEFFIRKKNILGINVRLNFSGGERVSPILSDKSLEEKTVYYDETRPFENQMPAIKYLDLTITYRINRVRYSSVWAFQMKNVLGESYSFEYVYNFKTNTIDDSKIVVVLPVLSYKIEF